MTIKLNYMQSVLKISLAVMLAVSLAACGSSSKDGNGDLKDKKAELEKLKAQQAEVNGKITKLEDELAKLDTSLAKKRKSKISNTGNYRYVCVYAFYRPAGKK